MSAATIRSITRKATSVAIQTQTRNITAGTNMLASSDIVLQKARPWYNSDKEGSNLAVDNEISMKDLFQGKKVAIFGVPAPFTGTCTLKHCESIIRRVWSLIHLFFPFVLTDIVRFYRSSLQRTCRRVEECWSR